jgi:hypothetical protein
MYKAKIICDSISETGKRLTTFEITFPRIVHAEAKTHRVIKRDDAIEELFYPGLGMNDEDSLSRNTASSRAIPYEKMRDRILADPYIPEQFPINGPGMQPKAYISKESDEIGYNNLKKEWLDSLYMIVERCNNLSYNYHIHKQLVNRLLEPFMWQTMICTATEYDNFFKLRTHPDAQYEIKRIADLMYDEYHFHQINCKADKSKDDMDCDCEYRPKLLKVGEWHLPYWNEEEDGFRLNELIARTNLEIGDTKYEQRYLGYKKKISVARCARVSYLTHDNKRDIEKDLELFERLKTSGHWSPFEHVATPYYLENIYLDVQLKRQDGLLLDDRLKEGFEWSKKKQVVSPKYLDLRSGNFIGWKQFRKEFQDENCTYFRKGQ